MFLAHMFKDEALRLQIFPDVNRIFWESNMFISNSKERTLRLETILYIVCSDLPLLFFVGKCLQNVANTQPCLYLTFVKMSG